MGCPGQDKVDEAAAKLGKAAAGAKRQVQVIEPMLQQQIPRKLPRARAPPGAAPARDRALKRLKTDDGEPPAQPGRPQQGALSTVAADQAQQLQSPPGSMSGGEASVLALQDVENEQGALGGPGDSSDSRPSIRDSEVPEHKRPALRERASRPQQLPVGDHNIERPAPQVL